MSQIQQIDQNMAAKEITKEQSIRWVSITEPAIRLSGFPFYHPGDPLGRIPKEWQKLFEIVNSNINELGTNTAGGQIAFQSNTTKVYIKAKTRSVHNMVNMTPTGQCGFDCYIGKDRQNLRFIGVTKFNIRSQTYEVEMAAYPCNGQMMEFLIHLPLYSGVEELMVGIDADASIQRPEPFTKQGGIVFYGTSITQGGCASRPGMAYTNIIGRKLNVETYNFGFSGNGYGESETADLLAEIEHPLLYVLDYEANAGTNGKLEATLSDFIQGLRKKHRQTPILVLSRLPYVLDVMLPELGEKRESLRNFQRETVMALKDHGDENIYFYDGSQLWEDDFDEYTIDTIHPTDLGFYMMAKKLIPVMKELID